MAKATKRHWRVKGQKNTIKAATYIGECASVDQLDATTPGFVAQLKGWLTRKRTRYATVFVDYHSDFDYIHPQMTLSSEETVKAKNAFETIASSHGIKIKHYHADNARFQDNAWKMDCERKAQGLIFCGSYVSAVKWRIDDADGMQHDVILPNTFYSEIVPHKLLSPQH